MPEIARDKFVSLLEESQLIDSGELSAALADAPDGPRAKVLARYLVNRGLLTRFQAQHLLAGHSGGFYLGQYRILDLIGRGGMGKVYRAEHTTMKRIVALKVLAADMTRTDRARELFRREVMAAARLVHPNIATAYDANEMNGRAFLVLEYVAGPSLSALVRSGGVLSVGQACEFIRQAALGLQYAHDLGMVHRDIKPSNLLVQPPVGQNTPIGGTLKIVDFGLALLPTADGDESLGSDQHAVLGTPDYLSPEQGKDIRGVDIRSDLYSLGCTLYFILTAQVPFPGGMALEKLARHAAEEAVPVDILRPLLHPGVAAIVHRLMAKKPEDRFQAPRDLADALSRFAEVQPLAWSQPGKKAGAPTLAFDEEWPADDPTHPIGGVNISGTISIAEFASALQAGDRAVFQPDYLEPKRTLPTRFWWAMALGFTLGVVLIAAAVYLRQ
jgi:eukaryotic-like serine/threonine-protein kinase